jgi:ribosomal protein L36
MNTKKGKYGPGKLREEAHKRNKNNKLVSRLQVIMLICNKSKLKVIS